MDKWSYKFALSLSLSLFSSAISFFFSSEFGEILLLGTTNFDKTTYQSSFSPTWLASIVKRESNFNQLQRNQSVRERERMRERERAREERDRWKEKSESNMAFSCAWVHYGRQQNSKKRDNFHILSLFRWIPTLNKK